MRSAGASRRGSPAAASLHALPRPTTSTTAALLTRADEHDAASREGRPLVRSAGIEIGRRLAEQRRHPHRASGPPLVQAFVEQRPGNRQPHATFDRSVSPLSPSSPTPPTSMLSETPDAERTASSRSTPSTTTGAGRRDALEPLRPVTIDRPGAASLAPSDSPAAIAPATISAVASAARRPAGTTRPPRSQSSGCSRRRPGRRSLQAGAGSRESRRPHRPAAEARRAERGRTRHAPLQGVARVENTNETRARAGQARRRCDPVTPSRWQFLRGIPAARGRSGPRCEWP